MADLSDGDDEVQTIATMVGHLDEVERTFDNFRERACNDDALARITTYLANRFSEFFGEIAA